MANITVSATSNFDSSANLGLGNGETITINSGAVLTINSDVRWGQNAAVPWDITITEGELKIDGSQTWWIPFDASSGNVPSLGTVGTDDVTIGGSNVGEFLGVFTAYGVAPSTAGTAMPASGYIKLRRKTGTINDNNVLTFSNSATATVNSSTGGQRGWIHFVGREATSTANGVATAQGLGKITITGDWFDLGTSNGTAGQTFQYFVSDYCPGIQVETGAGTGVYEWYGGATSSTFNASNLSTDDRSRFYLCTSGGLITFGGGTYGKLPPNGAKIRVPNVHVSNTTSTDYSVNTINTTTPIYRYKFNASPGNIDINYCACNGQIGATASELFKVQNSAGLDFCFNASGTYNSNVTFNNVTCSNQSSVGARTMIALSYASSVSFTDVVVFKVNGYDSASQPCSFSSLMNATFTNFQTFNLTSGAAVVGAVNCSNTTFDNCSFVGQGLYVLTLDGSKNCLVKNCKFDSKLVGASAGSTIFFISCNYGDTITIDGFSWYVVGLPTPYQACNFASCKNLRIRNIGSRSSNFSYPSREFAQITTSQNIRVAKVYTQQNGGYNLLSATAITCMDYSLSDVGQASAPNVGAIHYTNNENHRVRRSISGSQKIYSSSVVGGRTNTNFNVKGIHFGEQEVTYNSEIMLTVFTGAKKSTSDWSQNAYTEDAGTPLRNNANQLYLRNLNDQVTFTWNYWILGLTGFSNTAPIIEATNVNNHTITYDLDKGTGFSGTFKTLNAANLSAETGISASSGVKLRIRIVCSVASSTNAISAISIIGTCTSSSLSSNPYPYNEPLITLSNMQSGSLAAIFRDSDGKLLDYKSSSQPRLYPAWYADTTCTLRVRKPGWDSYDYSFTLTETDTTYSINQIDNSILDTNPGAKSITLTDHGASPVTWNGKQFSITVTVTDGSTPAEIARYLSWNTAQDSFSLGGGYHNMAWPTMVTLYDGSYQTQRGTLFGSAGATLKGVRVIDGSGNEISGFFRMQADDGTYYSPAFTGSSNLVVADVGEVELLDKMLKDALLVDEDYIIKLYQNNYTPANSSTSSSFTEANFTNYAAKTLTRANWSAASSVANQAQTSYSNQTWTCGITGNIIYGYYVIGATSGVLYWAERFATTRILGDTDTLTVTPKLILNSKY